MFRRLFTLVILAAVFLGGYHLGRKPNSPDIIGWIQKTYRSVASTGSELAAKTSGVANEVLAANSN